MKTDGVSTGAWVKSVGSGLLAGAAFVAMAMLVEHKAIKAGSRLFQK